MPATVDNLVLLTFDEAEAHESQHLEDIKRSDPGFAAFVEQVLQQVT